MISICICSVNSQRAEELHHNIQQTIGSDFEVISIDNSRNTYSICEAYNKAAAMARYPFLCFVHEDVKFHTSGWGPVLLDLFQDPTIGLVGVAGGAYKSQALGLAFNGESTDTLRINLLQHRNGQSVHDFYNPLNEKLSDVVVLDGVFLACPSATWRKTPFDADTLKGFHFYDMDFSLSVRQEQRVCVTYDLLLEHFSQGSLNASWLEQSRIAHTKWRHSLPQSSTPLKEEEIKEKEYRSAEFLFLYLIEKKAKRGQLLTQWMELFRRKPFQKLTVHFLLMAIKAT